MLSLKSFWWILMALIVVNVAAGGYVYDKMSDRGGTYMIRCQIW